MSPCSVTLALPAAVVLSIALLASAAGPSGNVQTRASAPQVIPPSVVPKGARSNLWMKPKTSLPKCAGNPAMCAAGDAPGFITKRAGGCPDWNQCSFVDKFNTISGRWLAANGYANGQPFNSWWSKNKATIHLGAKKLKLGLDKVPGFGMPFRSGQLQTKKWYGYGCYEVRMKPIKQEGLISTFFTYTGKWDHAPGAASSHNEVDIEFVWKKAQGKLMMQANYFTNGKGGNEHYIGLPFAPEKAFHNYGFRWTASKIEWFVDGKKVYTASKKTPKAHVSHHKIMMNFWSVSPKATGWGGWFKYQGPRTVLYDAVRFTKGANCKIMNNF